MKFDNKSETLISLEDNDINLPFFAYGIFKPDEFAYGQIENYVNSNNVHKCYIDGYSMQSHDGIPIVECCGYGQTSGYEIRFNDSKSAYKAIQDMEPGIMYEWGNCCDSLGNKCNILLGTKRALGYGHPEPIDNNEWSRECDPLFNNGLEYLRYFYFDKILSHKEIGPQLIIKERRFIETKVKNTFYDVFEFQKAYLFLFTILDRICTMKFGLKSSGNHRKIRKLAADDSFKSFFVEYGDTMLPFLPKTVNSSLMDSYVKVDNGCSETIIDVFYQIRNNCVHTGKALDFDKILLRQGFMVLFALVWYIVKRGADKTIAVESIIEKGIKPYVL